MAVFTISANTNYSAIKASLANGDTIRIDTNAVRLTVDEAPLLTGITVDSPGVSGRMTVSGAYDLSTWSIIAGTVALIDGTFPTGATLGSATGGSASVAFGVSTNAGTVINANGGGFSNAHGINVNNGTVTTATGGSVASSSGVNSNAGTVTNANGGSFAAASGVATNSGRVVNANGGGASNANGVNTSNGAVTTATGGSVASAHGVNLSNTSVYTANGGSAVNALGINLSFGSCLRAVDGVGVAIGNVRGDFKIVIGPDFQTAVTNTNSTLTTIYSIGPLSNLAVLPVGVVVIQLSEGTSGLPIGRLISGGV